MNDMHYIFPFNAWRIQFDRVNVSLQNPGARILEPEKEVAIPSD
jgi:hypothetical protein